MKRAHGNPSPISNRIRCGIITKREKEKKRRTQVPTRPMTTIVPNEHPNKARSLWKKFEHTLWGALLAGTLICIGATRNPWVIYLFSPSGFLTVWPWIHENSLQRNPTLSHETLHVRTHAQAWRGVLDPNPRRIAIVSDYIGMSYSWVYGEVL